VEQDVQTVYLYGVPPVLRLRGDSQRRHSAALPSAITMVHLNADEWGAGSGTVTAIDSELQNAEHDSGHEPSSHASHRVCRLDRQLAEEG